MPWPIVAFAALFFAPSAGLAQSILGSAGNFTLLAGGNVGSVGDPTIGGGDVGYGVGITGISSEDVTGGMIIGPSGPVVEQALLDLQKAALGLTGMTATTTMSGVDLGDKTLPPGVYKFAAAAGMTGTLTLNANFQNNVYWVFQIGTSLTTAAGSMVTVINAPDGGMSDGIFWDVGASVTFGAGNTLLGNYLAGVSITYSATTNGVGGARTLVQTDLTLTANSIDAHGVAGGSDWTGGLMFNGLGDVVPVPEPATFALFTGLVALGLIWTQRRVFGKRETI